MPRRGHRMDGSTRYTIDHPVGLHCPNKSADVMLIQVLLGLWGTGLERRGLAETFRVPSPTKRLTIDGICGPKTLYWLMSFQASATGHPFTGRIDPMPANEPHYNWSWILENLNLQAAEVLPAREWNALEAGVYNGRRLSITDVGVAPARRA